MDEITFDINYKGRNYAVSLDKYDEVTIIVDGVWVGDGKWSGEQIEDCPAELDDDVYDLLDDRLSTLINLHR